MSSVVAKLTRMNLLKPPGFLEHNVHYETITGSQSYGVSDENSDMDVIGFCIPPKDMIFPHLRGEIPGFGTQVQRFEQFIGNATEVDRKYDVTIYSIVKFFQLCMENNPNMIDSLFTAQDCVVHCTKVGNMVREKRRMFLHKGAWHKFKGYAYSQLHKMDGKGVQTGSKRSELREKFGYDVKFAYHVVRLLDEIEQILTEGDIDLRRNREQMKAIRRGDVPKEDIVNFFNEKEKALESLYDKCTLPWGPPVDQIRQLLLNCLEEHYGNLADAVVEPEAALKALREVSETLERHRLLLV